MPSRFDQYLQPTQPTQQADSPTSRFDQYITPEPPKTPFIQRLETFVKPVDIFNPKSKINRFGDIAAGVADRVIKAPGQFLGGLVGGLTQGAITGLSGRNPLSARGRAEVTRTAKDTASFGGDIGKAGISLGVASLTPGLTQIIGLTFAGIVGKNMWDAASQTGTTDFKGLPATWDIIKNFEYSGWETMGLSPEEARWISQHFPGSGTAWNALFAWGTVAGIKGFVYNKLTNPRGVLKPEFIKEEPVKTFTTEQIRQGLEDAGFPQPPIVPEGTIIASRISAQGSGKLLEPIGGQVFVKWEFKPPTGEVAKIKTKSQLTDIWNKANKATPEASLISEARKYKTAEEFVKGQIKVSKNGNKYYDPSLYSNRTDFVREMEKLNPIEMNKDWMAKAKVQIDDAMELWGKKDPTKHVERISVDKIDLVEQPIVYKMTSSRNIDKPIETLYHPETGRYSLVDGRHRLEQAKFNKDTEIIATVEGKKVQSQLTDIWNKANEKQTEITVEPTVGIPKLAKGVEARAIESKLTEGFKNLPEYNKVNMQQQAQLATELVSNYPETAIEVALGNEPAPPGLLEESVFAAVEEYAQLNKDIELLEQLANSDLTSLATYMGQKIRALGERDPFSPVSIMKDVIKHRGEQLEKQQGQRKLKNLKTNELKKVKDASKRIKVVKETWESFIKSIEC